jgi:hypothetical protein
MHTPKALKVYGNPRGDHIKLMPDGSLRFVYRAGEVGCCFTMFCEVGAPYQPIMQKILDDNGLKLAADPLELPGRPWWADQLETKEG